MIELSSKIKHIVLDAVGTTIEAAPPVVNVYHQAAVNYGSKLTFQDLQQTFKAAFQKHWLARVSEYQDVTAAEAEEYALWKNIVFDTLDECTDKPACFNELHEYFAKGEAWRAYPDVAAFFDWCLSRGLTISIASNFDQRLHQVLRELPEFRAVTCVIPSTETLSRKPQLKFFKYVEHKLQATADQLLMIGDSWNEDILGATGAGWQAIYLDRQHQNLAAQTANQQHAAIGTTIPHLHSLAEFYS